MSQCLNASVRQCVNGGSENEKLQNRRTAKPQKLGRG